MTAKLCLRPVVSRTEKKRGTRGGSSWTLLLSCSHTLKKMGGKTSGLARGGVTKQTHCEECFMAGLRTGDAVKI